MQVENRGLFFLPRGTTISLSLALYCFIVVVSAASGNRQRKLEKTTQKIGLFNSTNKCNPVQLCCCASISESGLVLYLYSSTKHKYAIVGSKKQGCYSSDFGDEYYLLQLTYSVRCYCLLLVMLTFPLQKYVVQVRYKCNRFLYYVRNAEHHLTVGRNTPSHESAA